jgi:hypothetical protein
VYKFNWRVTHKCLSFGYMVKYLALFIVFCWPPQISISQSLPESIEIAQLKVMESILEIYDTPHPRYVLDHFVFSWRAVGIDPQVQYNKGQIISKESKLLFNQVKSGDTLLIKEVHAINSESPGKGLVKLPEKKFILK